MNSAVLMHMHHLPFSFFLYLSARAHIYIMDMDTLNGITSSGVEHLPMWQFDGLERAMAINFTASPIHCSFTI